MTTPTREQVVQKWINITLVPCTHEEAFCRGYELARADLEQENAELKDEVERLKRLARIEEIASSNCAHKDEADELRQQLAASELHASKLREALETCDSGLSELYFDQHMVEEVLATPYSTSALNEWGSKLVEAFGRQFGERYVTDDEIKWFADKIRKGEMP
jgi:hypothetical protein